MRQAFYYICDTIIKVVALTVYVDVLITVNFIIDYFLISLTTAVLKTKIIFRRQLIAAGIGAVSSLIILLDIGFLPIMLIRLVISAAIIFCGYGFDSTAQFIRKIICFYIASFLFSGIMEAVLRLLGPNGLIVHNGVVYYNLSATLLVVLSAVIYCIITVICRIAARGNHKTCTIVIKNDNSEIKLNTLVDSGNRLKEPFSEKYVLIVDKKYSDKITLTNGTQRIIPYSTVSNDGCLTGYYFDKVYLLCDKKEKPLDLYLAFSPTELTGGIDAIISDDAL